MKKIKVIIEVIAEPDEIAIALSNWSDWIEVGGNNGIRPIVDSNFYKIGIISVEDAE